MFKMGEGVDSDQIESLPILGNLAPLFSGKSLGDVTLIACQHLIVQTHLILKALHDMGLVKSKCFILGKCYSSNNQVIDEIRRDGFYVSPLSVEFDSHSSFDCQYERYVSSFVDHALSFCRNDEKIILLDDGGFLIDEFIRKLNSNNKFVIHGVEQTSSGYTRLKSLEIPFPVVNVARSYVKLNIEAPIISNSIIQKIMIRICAINLSINRVLIIGNGPIGYGVARELLSLGKKVTVYDADPSISDVSRDCLDEILGDFDIVIGCTGGLSFDDSMISSLKNGVVLASASSSDREFCAVDFRLSIERYYACHSDICISVNEKDIILLNSGFPVNFDGKRHDVSLKNIQATAGLLYGAVLLCDEFCGARGFVDVPRYLQDSIEGIVSAI